MTVRGVYADSDGAGKNGNTTTQSKSTKDYGEKIMLSFTIPLVPITKGSD